MKRSIRTLASLGVAGSASAGLEALPGHWDITPTYSVATQEWSWAIIEGPVSNAPEAVFFPGYDGDYLEGEGERLERPAGTEWDLLGVSEGEPVWVFPETVTYASQAEPGFGVTQFGLFSENLRVSLAGVDGPDGGHFSLSDQFPPVIHMATVNGIDGADTLSKPDFHAHFNWFFTRQGMWRVRLQVMGYFGPGSTDPTPLSAEVPLHFAIGGVARWRAENFDAAVVMDEAVAGAEADADGDGLANLVEYALGGDPNDGASFSAAHGGRVAPEPGMDDGRLTLSFHRRSAPPADEGIEVEVEWADDLSGPWIAGGTETAVVTAPGGWERVTLRDAAPVPGDSRFARVRVTELP